MQRYFMIQYRKERGIDLLTMARRCEISRTLLDLLESSDSDVTCPKIAERIGKAYELDEMQIEGLMPEHHRKSSPNYDPNRYKRDENEYTDFAIKRWEDPELM